MDRTDRDGDRDVADGKLPNAVRDRDLARSKTFDRFGCDALEFGDRHLGVGLVSQPAHRSSVVGSFAHDAGKTSDRAAARTTYRRFDLRRIDRIVQDAQAAHPPPTGGSRANSSPSLNASSAPTMRPLRANRVDARSAWIAGASANSTAQA